MPKKIEVESVFYHLPGAREPKYNQGKLAEAEAVRKRGNKLMLVIGYHVINPFHGVPPHLDIAPDGTQSITNNFERRKAGLGYAPFARKELWQWATAAIENLLYTFKPDYIQQDANPEHRQGWKFTADKPYYHYNDTMGLFNEAIIRAGWKGGYVVSWPRANAHQSMAKARQYFGADNAFHVEEVKLIWPEDPVDDGTDPPGEHTCEEMLEYTEEKLKVAEQSATECHAKYKECVKQNLELLAEIKGNEEKYQKMIVERNQAIEALEECQRMSWIERLLANWRK